MVYFTVFFFVISIEYLVFWRISKLYVTPEQCLILNKFSFVYYLFITICLLCLLGRTTRIFFSKSTAFFGQYRTKKVWTSSIYVHQSCYTGKTIISQSSQNIIRLYELKNYYKSPSRSPVEPFLCLCKSLEKNTLSLLVFLNLIQFLTLLSFRLKICWIQNHFSFNNARSQCKSWR